MRKLIVNNFVTLDGLYEGKDKRINSLYDYYHEDYQGDDSFDFYSAERLRAADFLLPSDHGINHLDLYFLDGSGPSDAIIKKFLEQAEAEPDALAVHCKV